MSRAFVKEDDQEEAPFVVPRAPLPSGVTNYVTPQGLEALLAEKGQLENKKEKAFQLENASEKRRATTEINGELKLLEERINSARVLNPEDQPTDEVRFGAKVKLEINGDPKRFQLVGVDEANVKEQKIAFTAPIARAIIGKHVNETALLMLGTQTKLLKIKEINY
jgi:transcription elongation factor GreB